MLIPANSIVQAVLQGHTKLTKGANQILSEMTPYFTSANISVLQTHLPFGLEDILSTVFPASFTATITLQPAADTDDIFIANQVAQAYRNVTGDSGGSVSIPQVGGQATGEPGVPSDLITSTGDTISNFFSSLKSAGTSVLVGLAAVVIIVLLIVAFGPNIGSIARAAA